MAKFKITCDEATTICDKSQYGKATILEIIKLKIHFLGCKICSLYTKQNTLLSKILNKNKGGNAICSLTVEEKKMMRLKFEEESAKL
jgi:predicted ATP-binding protein involved in virulence